MPREKRRHIGGKTASLHPVVNGFCLIELDVLLETALLKGTEPGTVEQKAEGVCRNGNLVRNAGECVLEVLSEEILERQGKHRDLAHVSVAEGFVLHNPEPVEKLFLK